MPLLKSDKHHNNNRERPIIEGRTYGNEGYPRDQGTWGGQDYPPSGIAPGPGGYDHGYGNHHLQTDQYNRALANDDTATAVPPASAISHGAGGPGHTTGPGRSGGVPMGTGGTTGKVEAAIGSVIGSRSLKEKGLQKQYEAEALKHQGAELAEAERLENEARIRRDRAVGHGAHPDNLQPSHPGGGRAAGGFGGNQDNRGTW